MPRAKAASDPYAKLTRMRRSLISVLLALLGTGGFARQASAQTFEVLGTRAAGMGGAFVGVADDASAVYWNPAGLVLGGSYFSMLLDNNQGKAEPDDIPQAGSQSATIIALTTLPFGVTYYRLSATTLTPTADPQSVRLERLTTHHAGVTFVQSLTDRIAVASTLKWVHGLAASGAVPTGDRDDLLDGSGELPDASTNKFDADIGLMALFGAVRASRGRSVIFKTLPLAPRRRSSSGCRCGAAFGSTLSAVNPGATPRSIAWAGAWRPSGRCSSTPRSRSALARATAAGASRRGWFTDSGFEAQETRGSKTFD